MKTKIDKEKLKDLVLKGISSSELDTKYDYSHITDMRYMFYNCSSLESVPELDTSNVTDMSYMFSSCSNLKDIDLYKYLSSNIKSIDSKFLKEKYPELYI